jgi:putative ABC transport system ATP-binding protein
MSALIDLAGVSKRYQVGDGELEVLHGIDLRIDQGEFVAIMGPSGSGKTTCLEIMGVISRPSEGEYRFDGESVARRDDDQLADLRARRMGFVFQTFNLMPRMSALRNVALPLVYAGVPRTEREGRAEAMLERMGLSHRRHHLPAQMSGGERQRVALARALVNRPRVIFADEPTGNLDETTGRDILAIFSEIHDEGGTLVVVTHSEAVAACAGRVVRLHDGRIARDGESS